MLVENELKKLKTFDSSYFIGKSHFEEDGTQNYLAFQPLNCECEWDKVCDVGEYLDYENCKCRKKLVHKLVDECTETVEEWN